MLNDWTARELDARPATPRSSSSTSGTRPRDCAPAHASIHRRRDRADDAGWPPTGGSRPSYPGITEAESLSDWDPPFPLDLSRVRPQDEEVLARLSHDAEGFIPYERARDLWATRYGTLTGLRFAVAPARMPARWRRAAAAAAAAARARRRRD